MGDVRRGVAMRGLGTLLLVATMALSSWTLAPVRSAVAENVARTPEPAPLSLPEGMFDVIARTEIVPPLTLDAAMSYVAGRGLVGLSVIDRQTGNYVDNGVGAHTPMGAASVIKVVIAEEILHRAAVGQVQLGPVEYARIEAMLVSSDDGAASHLYSQFGGVALIAAALNRHQLGESAPPLDPQYWGNTKISAHDTAVFYENLLDGSLPPPGREYILTLLRRIAPSASDGFGQTFGLAALDPALGAAVKQGWMCCLDGVRDVHSTGILGADDRYVVVILSEYAPSLPWEYGRTTTTDLALIVLGELAF